MAKEIICSPNAPAALGPYVQAIKCNGMIYCSGQLGIDPATGKLCEGVEAQAAQSLKNLKSVLEEAGSGLGKVVKATIFLQDIADFAAINKIYADAFEGNYPARSCFQVGCLPAGGLIEIEVIAEA